MPTTYFNVTNNYVVKLVDNKNFEKLDEYLDDKFDIYNKDYDLLSISTSGNHLGPWLWDSVSDQYNEKLYDIVSYAITSSNIDVVKYYLDLVNPNDCLNDGNIYTYLNLAKKFAVNSYSDASYEIYSLLLQKSLKEN